MCVQKVAGASRDRWDHGAPTGQRRTPWSRGYCVCSHSHHKTSRLSTSGRFPSSMTEPDLPEHEVQEPEDTHKKGKPCLILFQTRSVQDTFHDACFCLTRHDLFKTPSVQDTFHDVCSCLTPHVNFSGDRVRGARFCRHLHRALSSDRVRGACTLPTPLQRVLQQSNTWYLHLLSPTQHLLQ